MCNEGIVEGNVVLMVVGRFWFEDKVDDKWLDADIDNDADQAELDELSVSIVTGDVGLLMASINDNTSKERNSFCVKVKELLLCCF